VYAETPTTRENIIERITSLLEYFKKYECKQIFYLLLTVFNVESNYASTTIDMCSNI